LFLAVKQVVLALKQLVSDCTQIGGTTCFAVSWFDETRAFRKSE
jgi:hypothetical protein